MKKRIIEFAVKMVMILIVVSLVIICTEWYNITFLPKSWLTCQATTTAKTYLCVEIH